MGFTLHGIRRSKMRLSKDCENVTFREKAEQSHVTT